MPDATVTNQATVSLTTALVHGQLQVLYRSTVLGTITDQFCKGSLVPPVVRLYVAYLPGGTAVQGVWGPNQTAFHDDPTHNRIFADMPTPTSTNLNDFQFTISEDGPTPSVDDPHLVLKTNVDC